MTTEEREEALDRVHTLMNEVWYGYPYLFFEEFAIEMGRLEDQEPDVDRKALYENLGDYFREAAYGISALMGPKEGK